jgi:phosphoserine phosphatase
MEMIWSVKPFFIKLAEEYPVADTLFVCPLFFLEATMLAEKFPLGFDWPGFDFIFFDCDSTLSTIEGIDELARQKGKFEEVRQMTDAAMEGEVHLQTVYDRRLALLAPTRAEIRNLEQLYRQNLAVDAVEVVQALQTLNREVFVVSGGLSAAVRPFGEWLGIPRQNIKAVEVRYNYLSGQWWDYQQDQWGQRPDVLYLNPEETPLIESQGKATVIRELLGGRAGRAMLVGDGMSDLAARPAVEWVVGFGGVVSRRKVAEEADVFIKCATLAPVLPLALPRKEWNDLQNLTHRSVLKKGLALIEAGQVTFREAVTGFKE